MIRYDFHGLVEVRVEPGVSESLRRNLDFHIGHFRSPEGGAEARARIRVRPFDAFRAQSGEAMHTFHLVRGLTGRLLHDPVRSLAIEATERGFDVYAERPEFLINLLLQILLLREGVTLVHAAAVVDAGGRAILLPGAGGVGKTALLASLLAGGGHRLLGDDLIGLSAEGECLSFPREFVLKEYHRAVYPEVFARLESRPVGRPPLRRRLFRLLVDNAPFKGLAKAALRGSALRTRLARAADVEVGDSEYTTVPVTEIFAPEQIAAAGALGPIVFLERYAGRDFRTEPLGAEALVGRMFSIIHHEWVDYMRQLFTLGALEIVDLPAYFAGVAEVIRRGIAGRDAVLMLIPDDAGPDRLAREFDRVLASTDRVAPGADG